MSADPISLMRGAPNRELAVQFIEYVLSEEGQRLWNQRPGTPKGPHKFSLRRLPIRRDFYPASEDVPNTLYTEIKDLSADPLGSDEVNPYQLSQQFKYTGRWTGRHFGIQRQLIRAMCLDAGEELQSAWAAIQKAGGPAAVPEAMEALLQLPDGLTWESATGPDYRSDKKIEYMREWVLFFRKQYALARQLAEEGSDA